jgi:hypothetical protein
MMGPMTRVFLPLLLCCTQAPPGEIKPDETGTPIDSGRLALRYTISPALVEQMEEPARGVFYGQLFDAETGETLLDSVEHHLDLGDGTIPTDLLHTTVPITVQEVVVMGFLDSDANAGETGMGEDAGDPVALPEDNRLAVIIDSTNAVTVLLGALHASR